MSLIITQESSGSQVVAEFSGQKYQLNEVVCYNEGNWGELPEKIKDNLPENITEVMVAYVDKANENQTFEISDQMTSKDDSGSPNGMVVVFYVNGSTSYTVAGQPTKGEVKIGLG